MTDRLRIPPEWDLPPARMFQRKEHLMRELTLEKTPTAQSLAAKKRRRWIAALVPAALIAVGWTTYALTRPVTQPAAIACLDKADPEKASGSVVAATGEDPVAICARVWEKDHGGREAPPLVACVTTSGAVSVVPGRGAEACERFGRGVLPAEYGDTATRFAGLRDALHRQIPQEGSGRCVSLQEAEAIVRRELDERGFEDYRIEYHEDSWTEGDCAGLSYDSNAVWLVPEEPL